MNLTDIWVSLAAIESVLFGIVLAAWLLKPEDLDLIGPTIFSVNKAEPEPSELLNFLTKHQKLLVTTLVTLQVLMGIVIVGVIVTRVLPSSPIGLSGLPVIIAWTFVSVFGLLVRGRRRQRRQQGQSGFKSSAPTPDDM